MRKIQMIALPLAILMSMLITPPAPAAEKTDIQKNLNRVIPKYSIACPMDKAVEKLQKLGEVKIFVDWVEIEDTGVKRDTKVVLKGTKTKFVDIVELMLFQVMKKGKPLGWHLQGDLLCLTTQARVLSRRRTAEAPRQARKTDRDQDVQARPRRSSEKTLQEFKFDGVPLEDVIDYFREMSGVNFFVNWQALEGEGITKKTPVTFRAKGISFATALGLVMNELSGGKDRMSSIHWVVDRGIVHISTGASLNEIMRTRVIDVANLLQVVPNFVGPRVDAEALTKTTGQTGDSNGGEGGGSLWEEEEGERPKAREKSLPELREEQRNTLIAIIKSTIGEDMWYPSGKGTIKIFKNQLVITQSLLGFKLMREANRN